MKRASSVLDLRLCIGCGVCCAVCPETCIGMRFDRYGEYHPVATTSACTHCGLCLSACPFVDSPMDEGTLAAARFKEVPGIEHRHECGYVLSAHVGALADDGRRSARSSGGLASWFLAELLKRNHVDAVICVLNTESGETAFEYALLETPAAVLNSSKSCYYPVELSQVLRSVVHDNRRYAVVGLPCVLKAIQKAAAKNSALKDRIVLHVGLTCGHQKSARFAEYLCKERSACAEKHAISFRESEPGTPPYRFVFSCRHGRNRQWSSRAFERGWFKIGACRCCDDVFAECADVAFMDAWLPGYRDDSRGTSIVLSRKPFISELFDGRNRDIRVERLDLDSVIQSQLPVLANKRERLSKRQALRFLRSNRLHKRVASCHCGWLETGGLYVAEMASWMTRELWCLLRLLPFGRWLFNLLVWHIPSFCRKCLRRVGKLVGCKPLAVRSTCSGEQVKQ